MKKTIKAYVSMNEYKKIHYYRNFEIIERLPKKDETFKGEEIIEINEVSLDCEQGNDKVYDYDYYEITTKNYDDLNEEWDETTYYVAIQIED